MSWFEKIMPSRIKTERRTRSVPEGLWIKCPACDAVLYRAELERNLYVCPKCSHHMRIRARERLERFLDADGVVEIGAEITPEDPLKFRDSKRYKDRLAQAQKATGEKDALIVLAGKLHGLEIVACAFEFQFLGGSMGSVVGERFKRAVDHCIEHRKPLVCFSASGGARMQEALFSLLQMAKTSAALARLARRAEQVVKAAGARMRLQHCQGLVQRRAVQHGARQEHARHPGMAPARAQVVDDLDQSGPVGAEGVSRQRPRIGEGDIARRVVGPHVQQQAAAVQVRVAILVMADPARAVGAMPGNRRATLGRAVQQVAAAVPQQHVGQRHAQAFGQSFELFPDRRQRALHAAGQFVQVGVAAPGTQRRPDRALRQVSGHARSGQLADFLADPAARSANRLKFEWHGFSGLRSL